MKLTYRTRNGFNGNTTLEFTTTDDRAEITLTHMFDYCDMSDEVLVYGADAGTPLEDLVQEQLDEIVDFFDETLWEKRENYLYSYKNESLLAFEKILIEVKWGMIRPKLEV